MRQQCCDEEWMLLMTLASVQATLISQYGKKKFDLRITFWKLGDLFLNWFSAEREAKR